MNKPQVIFLMIAISAITLIGRDVFDGSAIPNIAHAQDTQPAQSRAQIKWEYCALQANGSSRSSFGSRVYYTTIQYYQPSDWRTETVELDQGSEEKVVAKAIAKLGEEGWEMVHDRTHEGTTTRIYFKRPKQ